MLCNASASVYSVFRYSFISSSAWPYSLSVGVFREAISASRISWSWSLRAPRYSSRRLKNRCQSSRPSSVSGGVMAYQPVIKTCLRETSSSARDAETLATVV